MNTIIRASTAAILAAVLGTFVLASPALGQSSGDIPSVGVTPTESRPEDPNQGQWFVLTIEPGRTGRTEARIGNPAEVAQKIRLYVRDLDFAKDGTPSVREGNQEGVGAWSRVDRPELVVPPGEFVRVGFIIEVPANAEPGDHVGVLVAESQPTGGDIKIVKRIATRVYVTVPGDATKAFRIESVTKSLGGGLFPSKLDVDVTVRNTGRVRLHPAVDVAGTKATGADPLLASSVEIYATQVDVPWYGGSVKVPIRVSADGVVRETTVSMFVIPWGVLATVPAAAVALVLARALWRLRTRKMRRLQADLRRLEKLVADRPDGAQVVMEVARAAGGTEDEAEARARSARLALKRARRSKATGSMGKLALELHGTGAAALDELLEALGQGIDDERDALLAAIVSYGPTVLDHNRFATLPDDVAAQLRQAIRPARPRRRATPIAAKPTTGSRRAAPGRPTLPHDPEEAGISAGAPAAVGGRRRTPE